MRTFFIGFVAMHFVAALPRPAAGSTAWYDALLAWSWRHPGAFAFPILEKLGFHHRWNMFAHAPRDPSHAWHNVHYEIHVKGAGNSPAKVYLLPDNGRPWAERYLDYRLIKFKNSFWATKGQTAQPFTHYFARQYRSEFPDAQFPIDVNVMSRFTRIYAPGAQPVSNPPFLSTTERRAITQADLMRCTSDRDWGTGHPPW